MRERTGKYRSYYLSITYDSNMEVVSDPILFCALDSQFSQKPVDCVGYCVSFTLARSSLQWLCHGCGLVY
ncbi:hypothetical protein GCM10020001_055960 [Nonomuraea salmonea]